MTHITNFLIFTVPLTFSNFKLAQKFSQQQKYEDKARQVFLNTLAILAVNFYCQCLQIETCLETSDSWNSTIRILLDIADLKLKNLGKLECRPILPHETFCYVPSEVRSGRIGYIVVEIDEENKQARLLGFIREVETEKLSLTQLHPLDELLTLFQNLAAIERLEKLFNAKWQDAEQLLSLSYRRNSLNFSRKLGIIKKAKRIQLADREFALIAQVKLDSEQKIHLHLQVYPLGDIKSLPPNLELAIVDLGDNLINATQARRGDNWLKLNHHMLPTEVIKIRMTQEFLSVWESFPN